MDPLRSIFWRPLREAAEWVDITPISLQQEDDDEKVAAIEYDAEVEDTLGYLYAVEALPLEASERMMNLSRKAIFCNMCGYTAWRFRLKVEIQHPVSQAPNLTHVLDEDFSHWNLHHSCFKVFGGLHNAVVDCLERRPCPVSGVPCDLQVLLNLDSQLSFRYRRDEEFSEEVLSDMPKNYQLWNHRRQLLEEGVSGSEAKAFELEFTETALEDNAKSHHAWAHRQAVLADVEEGLLAEENLFNDRILDDDIHNNSSWTQRYFVLQKNLDNTEKCKLVLETEEGAGMSSKSQSVGEILLEDEMKYTTQKILLAPHNRASWVYLLGLMKDPRLGDAFLRHIEDVFNLLRTVLQRWPSCPPAVDVMGQMYLKLSQLAIAIEDSEKAIKSGKNAIKCWDSLQIIDPIRAPYYKHMVQKMEGCLTRLLDE